MLLTESVSDYSLPFQSILVFSFIFPLLYYPTQRQFVTRNTMSRYSALGRCLERLSAMITSSSREYLGWLFLFSCYSHIPLQKTLTHGTSAFGHNSCCGNLNVYHHVLCKSTPSLWQRCFYGNVLLKAIELLQDVPEGFFCALSVLTLSV